MLLFSGSSNKPLAEKIATQMQLELSPIELHTFPDGERRIRIEENVVGQDCVVVQSTSTPVDENYMELYFIVDALKRSGAASVTVIIPYLGYQRQDHVFRTGEARSLEVVIRFLETCGVDHIIGFDFHSIKIPELFHIPVTHLSALPLFAEVITQYKLDGPDTVLVSPDMGGIRRIKLISEELNNMPYVALEKNRDLMSGDIEVREIVGRVKEKAVIVDDMIASGKTIVSGAELLKKHGVAEIYVFATHPVFSKDAPELLQNSDVKKVFVTDTIHVPPEKQFDKLEVLSIAPLIINEHTG